MAGESAKTSRECVRDGGYYELTISASAPISPPNVMLTPYAVSLIAGQSSGLMLRFQATIPPVHFSSAMTTPYRT
jgi:hypothetical protein